MLVFDKLNVLYLSAVFASRLSLRSASPRCGCDVGRRRRLRGAFCLEALDIVDTLVKSAAVDMVVVDSVAALVPKAELEGEMGDHHIALQVKTYLAQYNT